MKKGIHSFLALLFVISLLGCAKENNKVEQLSTQTQCNDQNNNWESFKLLSSMELSYAKEFSVDYYENDYKVLHIENENDLLLVPEGKDVPENLPDDMCVIKTPVEDIYLVSTSVMDYFRVLQSIDSISYVGSKKEDWYIDETREAMEQKEILYAGKYNAPDFEMLVEGDCSIAIENTMIYHNPEIKEQLEKLGIPVMVERSSYETHPLGRMEWVKFYGALLSKEDIANAFFEEQTKNIQSILDKDHTGKTVAFFYITSNGAANIRKPNDYIAKMIEMAGGNYIFSDLEVSEDNALSTMKMQMEEFYAKAKDADILIYNSTIDEEITTLDQLFDKSELFKDFKAVKNNEVYCTGKNMFQQSAQAGDFLEDLNKVIHNEGEEENKVFLYKVRP